MPKVVITYTDGTKSTTKYEYLCDAEDSGQRALGWDDVEKVEVFDRHGDLIYWGYPSSN